MPPPASQCESWRAVRLFRGGVDFAPPVVIDSPFPRAGGVPLRSSGASLRRLLARYARF
jgi:hypothetical protein